MTLTAPEHINNNTIKMVKFTATACALLAVGCADAYSTPSRASLRSMGTKSIPTASSRRVGASMKMEGELQQVGVVKASDI